MFRAAIALSSLCVLVALGACQHSPAPASVAGGECKIFADPGFRVLGATADDQTWINKTQETGIRSCGWQRPPKRQALAPPPPAAVIAPPVVEVDPAPPQRWYRKWLGT
jgi:hypothetical protein